MKVIVTSGAYTSDSWLVDVRHDYSDCSTVTFRGCLCMPLEVSPLTSAPDDVDVS